MIITEEFIEKNKTANGGWTFAQLSAIGVTWPPYRGWKAQVIGAEVTDEQAAQFVHFGTYRQSKSERKALRKAAKRRPVKASVPGSQKKRAQAFFVSANTDEFLSSYEWRRVRIAVLKRDGAVCACCGADRSDGVKLHVDHIKPRKLFPHLALSLDNLQVLCEVCNHGKGNWDMTDWREPQGVAAEHAAHLRAILQAD